ncbi:MAG: SUMF1/EgtB/PvdO family nonheme iron enzyme [Drouetiella hepatica Uher 2000/2452]|jgi:formylglycine-generating enzyme required for sulfatase activity/uncharacterized caspase-like protein|uniref:SUMF1/EgtB/PvdO family nonheme iron enzyme n=1 Tax=Drouetiella hepatica Uher 2000/2452 TaxID=904376 RepID=A0A951QIT2_9CYAN|nr:SUMF1/EgtB/PvdO family nonheme iron enzyme [Drouetiella hepatica Uher 2000/2452]
MRKVALLVGISEYEPELAALPSAAKDVEAMQRVLRHPEMGEFDEVIALINKPRQEIEDAIYTLFADRQKDDLLLLYFSGHGITVDSGEFYLSTRSTVKDGSRLRPTTAVAARDIHGWMNDSRSKRQVVILDCCFSGAFARGMTAKGEVNVHEQLGGEGRALLTASTSTQYAFEQEAFDLSIYTHFLVEGLEKGAADRDGDGIISVDELHEYVRGKVKEAAPAMTPEFYPVREGHRIFLAKSPKDDPKLKYRKEVERLVAQGKFSVFARRLLNDKRQDWGLSLEESAATEFEVLRPFREYARKLQEYEEALVEAIADEFPLSEFAQRDLQDYRSHLALKESDAEAIESRLFAPKWAERQQVQPPTLTQPETRLQHTPPTIKTQPFEFETAILVIKNQKPVITRSRKAAKAFAEDLGNGVTLDLVAIPGGTFLMGSPTHELERDTCEDPQHLVTVQPFCMGKYPVTQTQWRSVTQLPKINLDLNPDPSFFKGDKRPVEQVSWDEAIEFCDRLSRKTGRAYRLPSEAEWEYACRAGTTMPFYFGETLTPKLANYDCEYTYGTGIKGTYRQGLTTEVACFLANAFGLFDMHGNVWEWCIDHWHENYQGAPSDGSAWLSMNNNLSRRIRGGSWNNNPRLCRSAYRNRNKRNYQSNNLGFRVSVSLASTP